MPICIMRVSLAELCQFASRRISSVIASTGRFAATVYWPAHFYNKVGVNL